MCWCGCEGGTDVLPPQRKAKEYTCAVSDEESVECRYKQATGISQLSRRFDVRTLPELSTASAPSNKLALWDVELVGR